MTPLPGDFLTALPLPALTVDASERIAVANQAARDILGQNIEGRHYVTILRQPAVVQTIDDVLRDGQARECRYISSDGTEDTIFDVTVRAIPSGQQVLVSLVDVTYLERAGQMRRDFVANVSHELRTPLTALIGFIETLRGPARDDAAARERFLDIMEGEAARMNRLVGDLLSLSRVEGEQRVRPRDLVNLSDILKSVVDTLTELARDDGVRLELDVPEKDVMLTGDGDQLMQVFTNLIENGIKYGGSGGLVRLRMSTIPREPSLRGPAVRIDVIDQGPGIEDVHLPRLTERFYRVDNHRSRALGGTGLGLAIVKHIINRHRGRLRIESEMGKGACFSVILPLAAAQV